MSPYRNINTVNNNLWQTNILLTQTIFVVFFFFSFKIIHQIFNYILTINLSVPELAVDKFNSLLGDSLVIFFFFFSFYFPPFLELVLFFFFNSLFKIFSRSDASIRSFFALNSHFSKTLKFPLYIEKLF